MPVVTTRTNMTPWALPCYPIAMPRHSDFDLLHDGGRVYGPGLAAWSGGTFTGWHARQL